MPLNPSQTLPKELLKKLSLLIKKEFGLHFSERNKKDLERRIRNAAKKQESSSLETFMEELLKAPDKHERLKKLLNHLTTGETYFFRDSTFFNWIKEKLLPQLQNKPSPSYIWSAGCSSGEEPYSLAMLIHESPFPEKSFRILATDGRCCINKPLSHRDHRGNRGN